LIPASNHQFAACGFTHSIYANSGISAAVSTADNLQLWRFMGRLWNRLNCYRGWAQPIDDASGSARLHHSDCNAF